MMTKDEKDAWNNGFEAHERGFSLDHCPHEDGPKRVAWIDGWNIAYETTSEKDKNACEKP